MIVYDICTVEQVGIANCTLDNEAMFSELHLAVCNVQELMLRHVLLHVLQLLYMYGRMQ